MDNEAKFYILILLNRIRTASYSKDDVALLTSKCVEPSAPDFLHDAQFYATNDKVDQHNTQEDE